MPSVTIKGISEKLLKELRESARRHKRSLNSEIIKILEDSQNTASPIFGELMKKVRQAHGRFSGTLSVPEINRAKRKERE